MSMAKRILLKLKQLKSISGQDLIEYALMAGFVATAATATMPGVAASIVRILCRVQAVLFLGGGGSFDAGTCLASLFG